MNSTNTRLVTEYYKKDRQQEHLPDAVSGGRGDDDDTLRQDWVEVADDVDARLGVVEVDGRHERLEDDVRAEPGKK